MSMNSFLVVSQTGQHRSGNVQRHGGRRRCGQYSHIDMSMVAPISNMNGRFSADLSSGLRFKYHDYAVHMNKKNIR